MSINKAITITVSLLVGAFLLLSYGNCQWGKWVYRWQVEVWPVNEGWMGVPIIQYPPEMYTGTWNSWISDTMYERRFCQNGKVEKIVSYHYEIDPTEVVTYDYSTAISQLTTYSANGDIYYDLCPFDTTARNLESEWDDTYREWSVDKFGKLLYLKIKVNGKNEIIYNMNSNIDRRAEFGMPIE